MREGLAPADWPTGQAGFLANGASTLLQVKSESEASGNRHLRRQRRGRAASLSWLAVDAARLGLARGSTPATSQVVARCSIGLVRSWMMIRPVPVTRAAESSTKVIAISKARVCILSASILNEH